MELVANNNEITITGNLKSIDDYQALRTLTTSLVQGGARQISYIIEDSLALTSSVIGYLIKLVRHDNVQISMQIFDYRLYDLLEELALTELFRARFVGSKRTR